MNLNESGVSTNLLIIGEMAATSPNYAQEYKHKIVGACMNKNGTTTLLRGNIKGNKF